LSHLAPNDARRHPLELDHLLRLLHVLPNLLRIRQSVKVLEENGYICFDVLSGLGLPDVVRNALIVLGTEELERLGKLLVVASVPVMKAGVP
jgi:hypothetical protein